MLPHAFTGSSRVAVGCALALAAAAPASADTIARWIVSQYQGPNNSGPMTPLPPAAAAPNTAATPISGGPGIVSLGPCGGGLSLLHCAGPGEMLSVFYSTTFNPDDYFEFAVTAASGYEITYQTLRVPMGIQYIIAPPAQRSSGPKTWQLWYSLDSFATPGTVVQTLNPFALGFSSPVGAGASEEAWPLFNVAPVGTRAGTVTFRLYGYNAETNHPAAPTGYAGGLMNRTVFMPQVDAVLSGTVQEEACYPDCNHDGALTISDFACFQSFFVTLAQYADCNADGQFTIADFGCFQGAFVQGCP